MRVELVIQTVNVVDVRCPQSLVGNFANLVDEILGTLERDVPSINLAGSLIGTTEEDVANVIMHIEVDGVTVNMTDGTTDVAI